MQKEYFGHDSIQNLSKVFDEYNVKSIFLITGKKSYTLSGAEKKLKPFLIDKKVTYFNDFSPFPDIIELEKGIKKYNKYIPDIVLAVGGGSVIDAGKIINLLANNLGEPLDYVKGLKKINNKGKVLIAIPTTAGTGSESTHFATVYINKKKYSLEDKKYMLPTVAIVDPVFTFSMSPYLTASTGLDTLCQGIESIWAVHSTDESMAYAREAVKLAVQTIEGVVNNPDEKSRLNMTKAAHLSGKAINISKTTAAHSISYPISSHFGISHGHAVALSLGQLIEFNASIHEQDCNDKRGVDFVKMRINEICSLLNCKKASDAKLFFHSLLKNIGVELRLNKLTIYDDERRLIVDESFTPNRMNNNPRRVLKRDIQNILDEIK